MPNLEWLNKLCPSFQYYTVVKYNKVDVLSLNYSQGKLLTWKKVQNNAEEWSHFSFQNYIRICAYKK